MTFRRVRRPGLALFSLSAVLILGFLAVAGPRADGSPPAGIAAKKNAKPGRYVGNYFTSEGKKLERYTFRVNRKGNRINRFRSIIGVICSYYPATTESHPFAFSGVKIKRNGSFKRTWKAKGKKNAKVTIRGRFRGKKLVQGKLIYRAGVCVRDAHLKAVRR